MTADPRSGRPGVPAGAGMGGGPGAEKLILEQAFDSDSLYALRAAVAAHAAQAGLPEERGDDLVVAVHELAANVIRHGPGHGRLLLWQSDQALRGEISDGPPEPAAAGASGPAAAAGASGPAAAAVSDGAARGGAAAAPWPIEHGHGLWLVSQLADEVSLRSGPEGTTATVSFTVGKPG